ncbi:Protein MODIFYING WALL LIGNIN-1, partial [Linum perenne]
QRNNCNSKVERNLRIIITTSPLLQLVLSQLKASFLSLNYSFQYSPSYLASYVSVMDNQRIWLLAVIISLTLVSFASSIIAETKKLKKKDVKLQNELCDLPQSHAFGFGVAALVCLVIAHTVSTLVIRISFSSSSTDKNNKKPTIPAVLLLLLSWYVIPQLVSFLGLCPSR